MMLDNRVRDIETSNIPVAGKRPVLLLGLPRSGSTWTGSALSRCAGVQYVLEPCDAYRWSAALWAKAGLAEYPTPYDAIDSRRFKNLWRKVLDHPTSFDEARLHNRLLLRTRPSLIRTMVQTRASFKGRRPIAGSVERLSSQYCEKRLLIKEVTVPFCSGVIADWLGADVIVLRRDPKKVVASWRKIGFQPEKVDKQSWVAKQLIKPLAIPKPPLKTHAERLAWTVGLLDLALMREAADRKWLTVTHEQLLANPIGEFQELVGKLGLKPTKEMWQFIDTSGKSEGTGYSTSRTAEQLRDSSKCVFSARDQAALEDVLALLGEHLPRTGGQD